MRKRYKIPVAKKGEWPNGDVIQVIDDASLDAIVKNTMASLGKTGKVLVDRDHFSETTPEIRKALNALGVQLDTRASGWIDEVYRDGDVVYGNMLATPDGEEDIESETYCKTSPTFRLIDCSLLGNRGGKKLLRPLKLKSVALTNLPNMATLGSVMKNREMILNTEDDLQSVFLGSAMDLIKEKNMEKKQDVIANATPVDPQAEQVKEDAKAVEATAETPTVEEVKTAAVEDVNGQVGIIAEAEGLTPEKAQAVADVAVAVVTDAVEAVEQATIESTPVASTIASGTEMEKANARVAELESKVAELQAIIDAAKAKEAEQALQNRIAEELAKYPAIQNREEAGELLRTSWDVGTKFLSSLKFSVSPAQKTIQNRVPAKSPEADMAGMSKHERLRFKMFGK